MEIKDLKHHLRKKKFELWFYCILVLVALSTFLLVNYGISSVVNSITRTFYKVSPMDEKDVYAGTENKLSDFYFLQNEHPSDLNGAIEEQNISGGQAAAVVIENYTPIRQLQKGLDKASVVYETLAEGGITRFLAIFDGSPVDVIGPVRSARPYFVTWASEYRAGLAHVGGSGEALGDIKDNFRIFNIDEMADSQTIWRDDSLDPPHNAFTSVYNIISKLTQSRYFHPMTIDRFPFKDPDKTAGDIKTISIDFSLEPYAVKYVFDPATSTYSRYNGGVLNKDVKPSDIIVQFVDSQVLDSAGRLRIQTNGTGNALVFRDGKVVEGTWEKDSSINSDSQPMDQSWTKFFDKDGKEIQLNRGQIWIEVVPNGRTVNYF